MFTKIIQSSLLAFAVLCPTVQAADAPAQGAFANGFVFASMPGAKAYDVVMLQSVGSEPKEYTLNAIATQDGRGVGLALPPGEYRPYGGRGLKVPKESYPVITVEAGRLTDLGALVFVEVSDNRVVMLPTRNADSDRNMQTVLKQLSATLTAGEPIVWRVDKVPGPFPWRDQGTLSRVSLAELQKAHESRATAAPVRQRLRETTAIDAFLSLAKSGAAPATTKPVQDAQGRMYFGAVLGQVRVRDANGVWGTLDTGCLHNVTAVETWNGQLVAGYDNGDVRRSVDGGKTWAQVASLERRVPVFDISRFDDQWFVATARPKVLRNGMPSTDQITVYSALKEDFSDIIKNRDFEVESEPLVRTSVAASKSHYYVNAFPKLWRLDAATQQWRALGLENEVHGFQLAPDNGTVAAYRIKGGFSKLYVSADHGDTWTKYDNPSYVIMDIRFRTPTQGQAVRWNMSAFSGTIELWDYDRAKDTWTKNSDAPLGCKHAVADAAQDIRFCVTPEGNILGKKDGKWGIEFAAGD